MQSILLVDSGSDLKGVPGAAEIHAERLSGMLDMPIGYAYLGLQGPLLTDVIAEKVSEGMDEFFVIPLMIASAEECGEMVSKALKVSFSNGCARYHVGDTDVHVILSEPFILHPLMRDVFRSIMSECRATPSRSEAVLINRCPADSSGDSIAGMCAAYLEEMGYDVRFCRLGRGRQTAGTVLRNISRDSKDCIAMIPMMSTPDVCSRCSVPEQLGLEGCPGSRSLRPGSRVHYIEEIGMRPGIVYILKSIVESRRVATT